MYVFPADQAAKILGVLGDQNPIFPDTPVEHPVVRLAASADMERMDRVVLTGVVQPFGDPRR